MNELPDQARFRAENRPESAPPGRVQDPRLNLEPADRAISAAAGAALSVAALRSRGLPAVLLGLAGGLLMTRAATGFGPLTRFAGPGPDDRAAAKAAGWPAASVKSRAVTINAPRDDIYRYFRDFANLPRFMENVRAVEVHDQYRSHWRVAAPMGEVEWEAEVTADQPGERIAWATRDGADIPNQGEIVFRDAPGGRGTEVHGVLAYAPPLGTVGVIAAKLTQKEPGIQLRRDLKRLKALFEAGEIATNAPQGAAPKA